jgi:hypothetical protein
MAEKRLSTINTKTHEVTCGMCGAKTFSRIHLEYGRKPLACPKCKNYFKFRER